MARLSTVFSVLLSVRLLSSFLNPIDDCDEVYNFYEPLHFIKYGNGLQTWEYSPDFALRSYAYIVFHWIPISFIPLQYKKASFYALRMFLSLLSAIGETFFYKSIEKQLNSSISRTYLLLSIFNVGLFRSSSSFINNSFSMFSILFGYSCWFSNRLKLSVFFIGLGSIFGWIYLVLLGVPIAFDILFRRRRYADFIRWSLVDGLIIIIPMIIVDSYFYGRIVVAPLNHIIYNLFSSNGPTLYGKEPWTYYLKNGLLNFNIVYPLSMIGLVLSPWIDLFVDHRSVQSGKASIPYSLIGSSVVLWMSVLWREQHKEDRFVYPIYPLILLFASVSINFVEMRTTRFLRWFRLDRRFASSIRSIFVYSIVVVHGCLSLSRTVSIVDGYSAPIRLLTHKNSTDYFDVCSPDEMNVCIGKDWFRFPSHFLLPSKSNLLFVRSQFRGQLPKLYDDSTFPSRTRNRPFNDENREQLDRYVELIRCSSMIDHDENVRSSFEPNFSDRCRKVTSMKMILPSGANSFFRSFYFPWLSEKQRQTSFIHLLDCRNKNYSFA